MTSTGLKKREKAVPFRVTGSYQGIVELRYVRESGPGDEERRAEYLKQRP